MCIYIRSAHIEDAGILAHIHSESWKAAYKGIVPDTVLDNMSVDKREQYFRKSLAGKWEEDYLIFGEDKPAGLICIGKCRDDDLDDSYGEIWGIYLLPSCWRQGIGSDAIKWGLEELSGRGYQNVTLWVLKENHNARSFYEKMGFAHDGTAKEINIGKPLEEYRYARAINNKQE